MSLVLPACADLSMYNQILAPMGRSGEATVKTYPINQPNEDDSYFSPSGDQNPAVVALLDSAYQQRSQGKYDIAASKLERAVRIAPKDSRIWHELANIRYQQQKFELAISLAKKSNVLAGKNRNIQKSNWILISKCYERLGDSEAARKARAKT